VFSAVLGQDEEQEREQVLVAAFEFVGELEDLEGVAERYAVELRQVGPRQPVAEATEAEQLVQAVKQTQMKGL
jgi:hypothetical protein